MILRVISYNLIPVDAEFDRISMPYDWERWGGDKCEQIVEEVAGIPTEMTGHEFPLHKLRPEHSMDVEDCRANRRH